MKQHFTGSKNRHQYVKWYLLFPFMLFFSWITVGNIIEQNYALADLNKITGEVKNLIITRKQFDKNGKGKELRIFLKNSPGYFRLTDHFNFQKIVDQVSKRKVLTIFYRKTDQLKWGFGRQTDIYHVQYKGSVLFDLRKRHENSFKITMVTGIGTFVLLLLLIFNRPKKISA